MTNYSDPIAVTREAVALAGSQAALARATGIAQQSISKILAGQIDPRRKTLAKIGAEADRLRRDAPAPPGTSPGGTAAGGDARRPLLTFAVPGEIVAWKRARTRHGSHFTDPDVASYMTAIAQEALNAMRSMRPRMRVRPTGEPLAVTVRATFRHAKKTTHGTPKTTKPDVDNIAKVVLDALSGIAYHDDAVVGRCTVAKVWGPAPELLVRVEAI